MKNVFFVALHRVRKIFSANYSSLLIFLILLFIFRPYDRSHYYIGLWQLLLTGATLSAVFNCEHVRLIKMIAAFLAIPSVLLSWLNLFFPKEGVVVSIASVTIPFLVICTASILYDVILRAKVTLETLRGVICAYFMVAFAFAYIYWIIEYLSPGAFSIFHQPVPLMKVPHVLSYAHYISEMLYFSFTTLLTIGYGDVVALKDFAQTFCVLEGIVGQFYVAILVSRFVAIYSFHSDERISKLLEKSVEYAKNQHGQGNGEKE